MYFLLFFYFWILNHIIISHKTARAHTSELASDSSSEVVCFSLSICKSVNLFRPTASLSGLLLALQSKYLQVVFLGVVVGLNEVVG